MSDTTAMEAPEGQPIPQEAPNTAPEGTQEAPKAPEGTSEPEEDFKALYEAEKARIADLEAKAKANEDAAKEYQKYLDSKKTDEQKAREEFERTQQELAEQRRQNDILRYGIKHGFDENDTKVLFGEDEEARMALIGDYRKDAIAFRDAMKAEGENALKTPPTLMPRTHLNSGTRMAPEKKPDDDRGYPSYWTK